MRSHPGGKGRSGRQLLLEKIRNAIDTFFTNRRRISKAAAGFPSIGSLSSASSNAVNAANLMAIRWVCEEQSPPAYCVSIASG